VLELRSTALTMLLAALLLWTCALPSDDSGSVYLTVDVGSGLVRTGDVLTVQARAWRGTGHGDDLELRGASFRWSTSDPTVARITPGEAGRAVVTGVRSGSVRLQVTSLDFAEAEPEDVPLRVANLLEIDRVTPDTVRYGEQVTVEGVGLGHLERVFLGEAPLTALIPDSGSFTGDSVGVGSMRFWVPYPAATQRLLALSQEGISTSAPESTVVLSRDLLEPSDPNDPPPIIELDGQVVREPDVIFRNPALALEGVDQDDSYHFRRSRELGPITLSLRSFASPLPGFGAELESNAGAFFDQWSIGSAKQGCKGDDYLIPEVPSDSVLLVLDGSDIDNFDLRVFAPAPSGYELEVRRGRPAPDPRIAPDRFEPNDFCQLADRNLEDLERSIDLGAGRASEVLTLDHAYDVDWYAFRVPGFDRQTVTIRVVSLPFGAADSSAVRAYLINGSPVASSDNAGVQTIVEELFGGDYYLVVVDEAGVPTRYGFCISLGVACTLPSPSGASRSPVEPALSTRTPP